MGDLDKLIEAVEAGNDWISPLADRAFTDKQHAVWACKAFGHEGQPGTSGSLDAAKALHEALLNKDRHFYLMEDEDAGGYQAEVYLSGWHYAGLSCPARAWLLAILRAHRAALAAKER